LKELFKVIQTKLLSLHSIIMFI